MLQSLQERILCHLAEFDWREQHDLQREQAALISVPSKPEDSEQKERLSARAKAAELRTHRGGFFFNFNTF